MVFTTLLFAVVVTARWKWNKWAVAGMLVALLTIDLSFWGANLPKIPTGGWFPLVVAGLMFVVMTTWKRGRQILGDRRLVAGLRASGDQRSPITPGIIRRLADIDLSRPLDRRYSALFQIAALQRVEPVDLISRVGAAQVEDVAAVGGVLRPRHSTGAARPLCRPA